MLSAGNRSTTLTPSLCPRMSLHRAEEEQQDGSGIAATTTAPTTSAAAAAAERAQQQQEQAVRRERAATGEATGTGAAGADTAAGAARRASIWGNPLYPPCVAAPPPIPPWSPYRIPLSRNQSRLAHRPLRLAMTPTTPTRNLPPAREHGRPLDGPPSLPKQTPSSCHASTTLSRWIPIHRVLPPPCKSAHDCGGGG